MARRPSSSPAPAITNAREQIEARRAPRAVEAARRWSRYSTTPAMLAVRALGLGLATEAGWFMTGWLRLKLVFVVALSGLHGLQSGALRRLATGTGGPAPLSENAAPIVVALALVIATLAVVKPL